MAPRNATFGFPFAVNSAGRISASGGDDAIRSKVIQVLFTAPGERVHVPDLGAASLTSSLSRMTLS